MRDMDIRVVVYLYPLEKGMHRGGCGKCGSINMHVNVSGFRLMGGPHTTTLECGDCGYREDSLKHIKRNITVSNSQ